MVNIHYLLVWLQSPSLNIRSCETLDQEQWHFVTYWISDKNWTSTIIIYHFSKTSYTSVLTKKKLVIICSVFHQIKLISLRQWSAEKRWELRYLSHHALASARNSADSTFHLCDSSGQKSRNEASRSDVEHLRNLASRNGTSRGNEPRLGEESFGSGEDREDSAEVAQVDLEY